MGDDFGCRLIVPTRFDFRKGERWAEAGSHLLEDAPAAIASEIKQGDIFVGGTGFGSGHAHYHLQAVKACQIRGVAALFAESFNAVFQRTAINEGLAAWVIPGLQTIINNRDSLEVDLGAGQAHNRTTDQSLTFEPVPSLVLEILEAQGLEGATLRWIADANRAATPQSAS